MIRKSITPFTPGESGVSLNLESLASFKITSENPNFPFENALSDGKTMWRAAEPGPQSIQINFDTPQEIRRIHLKFEEFEISRTQEFSLSWRKAGDIGWTELRRQQFNFSPGTSLENETIDLNLHAVAALELTINPSMSFGGIASLSRIAIQ